MLSDKRILAELSALKSAVMRVTDVQAVIIHGLRQDNRDLLNRLMIVTTSGGMQQYAATSPPTVAEMDIPAETLAKTDDFGRELLAGEIE